MYVQNRPHTEKPGNRLIHSRRKKTLRARHASYSARIELKPRPQFPDGVPVSTYIAFWLKVLVRRDIIQTRRKIHKYTYTYVQQHMRWYLSSVYSCVPSTPGSERPVPVMAPLHAPRSPSRSSAPVHSLWSQRAAVWGGRGATATPREAEWSSGVAAGFWVCCNQNVIKDLNDCYDVTSVLYSKDYVLRTICSI